MPSRRWTGRTDDREQVYKLQDQTTFQLKRQQEKNQGQCLLIFLSCVLLFSILKTKILEKDPKHKTP